MTIAATAQAVGASDEQAICSGKQGKNRVGRSKKKLQEFFRDVTA